MEKTPEPLLGTFAVLQALSGFVPVPLLDGVISRQIARRMVETVAGTHGIRLPQEEIKLFASEPDEGFFAFVKGAAKAVLLFPLKLLFKAVFLVLDAKETTELVGRWYARSVALDVVFGEGHYLAHGAAKVAPVVEAALAQVDTRPLARGSDAAWKALRAKGPDVLGAILGAFRKERDDEASVHARPLGEAYAEGIAADREGLRNALRGAIEASLGAPPPAPAATG